MMILYMLIEPHHGENLLFEHGERQRHRSAALLLFVAEIVSLFLGSITNISSLASLSGCTDKFVSDLMENPENRLSSDKTQLKESV